MKFVFAILSLWVLIVSAPSLVFAVEPPPTANTVKEEVVVPKDAVNINTADVQELTKLKGIGEKKAEAIVAWRKENGNFKSVDELLEVKGIGEATLEINRKNIRI
jgi:competence protein ComEA